MVFIRATTATHPKDRNTVITRAVAAAVKEAVLTVAALVDKAAGYETEATAAPYRSRRDSGGRSLIEGGSARSAQEQGGETVADRMGGGTKASRDRGAGNGPGRIRLLQRGRGTKKTREQEPVG